MDLTVIYGILARKIIEIINSTNSRVGCFKSILNAMLEEFGVDDVGELCKIFVYEPEKSYKRLVIMLGGFECSARALLIAFIGEMIKKYSPGLDAIEIVEAIRNNDKQALMEYVLFFAQRISELEVEGNF